MLLAGRFVGASFEMSWFLAGHSFLRGHATPVLLAGIEQALIYMFFSGGGSPRSGCRSGGGSESAGLACVYNRAAYGAEPYLCVLVDGEGMTPR